MSLLPRVVLLAGLALAAGGCPQKAQCEKAADCASLESTGCETCPSRAATYCEGGSCVDKPTDVVTVNMNMNTPRSLAMGSIRFAFVGIRAANLLPECENRPNCTAAAAVTCDDVNADGMDAARFNVAQAGARNASTEGGTITNFTGIGLGEVPKGTHLLVVDGHDGTMGGGNRVAHACVATNPSDNPTTVTVTLQAL